MIVPLRPRAEVSRRDALKLLAAGIAALEVGCTAAPGQDVLPYVADPPVHPGVAVHYATTLLHDGYAHGAIVETRDGRPIKLDGNPAHPATRGASTPILQARILDLYDPQRARVIEGAHAWRAALPAGPLWLVMPPQSSPAIARLLDAIRARRELHVVFDAPLSHAAALRGAELAFGRAVEQQVDIARAGAIAALDADWLATMPMSPAWARALGPRRGDIRLWSWAPMPTPTSSIADHAIAVRAGDVAAVAIVAVDHLARVLPADLVTAAVTRLGANAARAVDMANDLADRGGVTIAGDRQPAAVHALARWLDARCARGAATYTEPVVLAGTDTLAELAVALRAGEDAVLIDCNPVYTAPHLDLSLARATCVSMWPDETWRRCRVRVPLAHELEAWGDARAWDGTHSIAQPVIRPRFDVASPIEILAALAGDPRAPLDVVRGDLRDWHRALSSGVVAGTASPVIAAEPRLDAALIDALRALLAPGAAIEVALAPSVLHDGRHAGNAWLQELPHPITKQVWGNAAMMSADTAAMLGVDDGDLVRVSGVELPAAIVAEHADRAITIELGYGRDALPIARGIGASAYAIGAAISHAAVDVLGRRGEVIRTQHVMTREGREVGRTTAPADHAPRPTMLPDVPQVGWAMSIDTALCTGCSACMVACQAENNVAVVGARDVARGRHMAWIRIDRYVDAGVNMPMLCQHCEHAPCEYVCPTGATVHSPDGLNEMVYNRCVGTRFCSNNCPYKVRRFNWFAYEHDDSRSLQYNPSVTVRSRGVMEKCTYCVQRIRGAEERAHIEHRDLRPGEVVTACQQACPTGAIQFGRLEHTGTPLARMRRDPRRYDALGELGARPRTQYLAKVKP